MKKINKTFQISVQKVAFNYLWVGYIYIFLKIIRKACEFQFFFIQKFENKLHEI